MPKRAHLLRNQYPCNNLATAKIRLKPLLLLDYYKITEF